MMLSSSQSVRGCYPRLVVSSHARFASTEIKAIPLSHTHYQVLNIGQDADVSTIKKSFRKLSKRYHPDVNHRVPTSLKPIVKSNYLRIMNAYETLKDSNKRSKYDLSINARPIRSTSQNEFYSARKQYSAGGINQTRNRMWPGPGYRAAANSKFDTTQGPTGSNHDVPHFDYENHLRGNLWFERRMINKRISKLHQTPESASQKKQQDHEQFQHDKKRNLEDEINDTLNYHRFGEHQYSKDYTVAPNSALTTLVLLGLGTALTIGGIWAH